mgnify:CR=1 FL=1
MVHLLCKLRHQRVRDDMRQVTGHAEDPVMHDKTKHILRKELKIRELVESGEVKVEYVESLKKMTAWI